jgi:hypothetical protein
MLRLGVEAPPVGEAAGAHDVFLARDPRARAILEWTVPSGRPSRMAMSE